MITMRTIADSSIKGHTTKASGGAGEIHRALQAADEFWRNRLAEARANLSD